ncbi:unnamed protein product [Bubo scandiacus]
MASSDRPAARAVERKDADLFPICFLELIRSTSRSNFPFKVEQHEKRAQLHQRLPSAHGQCPPGSTGPAGELVAMAITSLTSRAKGRKSPQPRHRDAFCSGEGMAGAPFPMGSQKLIP